MYVCVCVYLLVVVGRKKVRIWDIVVGGDLRSVACFLQLKDTESVCNKDGDKYLGRAVNIVSSVINSMKR